MSSGLQEQGGLFSSCKECGVRNKWRGVVGVWGVVWGGWRGVAPVWQAS